MLISGTLVQVVQSYKIPALLAAALLASGALLGFNMAWFLLLLAGLFEIGFALSLKASDGFSKLWPSVLFIVCAILSLALLNFALKSLPIGTAYAVWTGVGAAGTAILGMVVLGEPVLATRVASIGLIIAGVIGLQLTGGH